MANKYAGLKEPENKGAFDRHSGLSQQSFDNLQTKLRDALTKNADLNKQITDLNGQIGSLITEKGDLEERLKEERLLSRRGDLFIREAIRLGRIEQLKKISNNYEQAFAQSNFDKSTDVNKQILDIARNVIIPFEQSEFYEQRKTEIANALDGLIQVLSGKPSPRHLETEGDYIIYRKAVSLLKENDRINNCPTLSAEGYKNRIRVAINNGLLNAKKEKNRIIAVEVSSLRKLMQAHEQVSIDLNEAYQEILPEDEFKAVTNAEYIPRSLATKLYRKAEKLAFGRRSTLTRGAYSNRINSLIKHSELPVKKINDEIFVHRETIEKIIRERISPKIA